MPLIQFEPPKEHFLCCMSVSAAQQACLVTPPKPIRPWSSGIRVLACASYSTCALSYFFLHVLCTTKQNFPFTVKLIYLSGWQLCDGKSISHSPPLFFSFPCVSSRLVTAMIRGRCGIQTPQGAPTITGHPVLRGTRQEGTLQSPGAPGHTATLRLTKAQVQTICIQKQQRTKNGIYKVFSLKLCWFFIKYTSYKENMLHNS